LEVTKNAIKLLKEGMTESQYRDYEKISGIQWGAYDTKLSEYIITFTAFCDLTYEEQIVYLNDLVNKYQVALNVKSSVTDVPE
jgi:hypothetical protein